MYIGTTRELPGEAPSEARALNIDRDHIYATI